MSEIIRGKDRREDEFGFVNEDSPMGIEEADNYLDTIKDKVKKKAAVEEFPVSTALPEDRKRFLESCISLLPKKYEKDRLLLMLLCIYGYTHGQVAMTLQKHGHGATTVQDVVEAEKVAMSRVSDAIQSAKKNRVPIIGGR